jgi:cytochrome P450 family 4
MYILTLYLWFELFYFILQDRIVEELVEVFGDSGRAPDMSDLANLKYLERCIKESMRLYPSVAFMERGPIEEVQLGKN